MTPPPPSSEPPETSIGSFRIVRKLGSGGMGEVFLAHDDRLRRDVAIKRIRAGASMGPDQRERLRREARAAAGLSHPSIVQVYDIIEESDGDSIVMEYVEGRTLFEMISDGELDGSAAIDVLLQVTDGLEAAHRVGLVHRDLKGENVIVGTDGDAKILDFGVAKSNDPADEDQALTTAGMAIGTYRSMSPEQCEGGAIDARSDLFSLGVLMYEMFGGRTPFAGKTPLHTLANVVGFDPPAVRELNGSIPESLSALIESLMAKEPDKRPDAASTVADTLEGLHDPALTGAIVMPRFTATPDSGIDPIGTLGKEGRTSHTRRRKTTTVAQRPSGRGRQAWVVAGMGVLAVAAGATWIIGGRAVDDEIAHRVMVFPLVVSSAEPLQASSGEDAATMIGTALDGTDPLDWIDGWHRLEGEARGDIGSLTVVQLAEIASSNECGFFIDGRVLHDPDSTRVILNLREASTGEAVATSREGVGPESPPWRAALRAMNALLPHLIETAVPDLEASFAAREPAAVVQFLLGEREFRRANMDVALQRFGQAFSLDTAFALAGLRGAQTASWEHDGDAARDMARRVLRLPLPPRSEAFARGILAFVENDAEEAITQFQRALEEDPTLTAAWAAMGEVYRHRAPRDPWLDGPRPFQRALEQDPLAAYVLYHRLEELVREGELPRADALLDQFRQGDPDPGLVRSVDVMLDCAKNGPRARDWARDVEAEAHDVLVAGGQLLVGGSNLPCAEVLFRAILMADTTSVDAEPRYWAAWLGLTGSKLAQGRLQDARRLIRAGSDGFETFQSLVDRSLVTDEGVVLPEGDAPWEPRVVPLRDDHVVSLTRWYELAVAAALLYEDLSDVGDLGAVALRRDAGPDLTGTSYRTSLFMLGAWEARSGNLAEARRVADRIRANAEAGIDTNPSFGLRIAEVLDIHIMLGEGQETEALEQLRELTTNAPEGIVWLELLGALPLERLLLAQLEERLGDPQRALNLVLGFDEPSSLTYIAYLPPGLATCVRTADRLRQNAQARSCEARLTELGWSVQDFSVAN